MNISILDQTKATPKLKTPYAEAVRLSNELRPQQARTTINIFGVREDLPAKWGFHEETAPISDFYKWLNDPTIDKSTSLFWHVIRVMAMRFESEHANMKSKLNPRHLNEFELILSELRNEVEFLGEVGFSGMVRLDKSLTNPRSKAVKNRDGSIKIVRK